MTQEDKDLLLRDLCARLPYGVICHYEAVMPLVGEVLNYGPLQEIKRNGEYFIVNGADCLYEDIKPYLRPMLSMTEEEKKEFESLGWRVDELDDNEPWTPYAYVVFDGVDWLNKKMFDYRGLIKKGLALKALDDMYNLEKK